MVRAESPAAEATGPSDEAAHPFGIPRLVRKYWAWSAAAVAALAVGLFFLERMNHVYVSDARIGASMISVSSRVPGWVAEFRASTADRVEAGDLLVSIDSRKARLELAELEARLHEIEAQRETAKARLEMVDRQTRSECEARRSRLAAASAALAQAASAVELSRRDFERAESLLERNVMPRQKWDELRTAHERALQEHEKARANVGAAEAAVLEAEAGRQQIEVLEAELARLSHLEDQMRAKQRQRELTVQDHDIRSPIRGVVDRTFANEGEFVSPGQRLLMIHDPDDVWVDSNVRETEIRHLELGLPATVAVDAYPGREFRGEIIRIGDAATSEFALLPNPNPSGNFTKITQRIPVRIAVAQSDGMLRPGMMVEVDIDIRDR
jgi:membrane fusion protein (multidrug efflux system)